MPIINGQGRVAVRVQVPLLLDTYTGAAAAYSLRKLTNTYNGSAIRVRRSSDNTEMNIGFNADGSLNTTALTTFVGAGDGFVTTWYDQSGNGKDASNNGAIYQPQIVTSGVVDSINGKPAIKQTEYQYLRLLPPPYGTWNIIPSFNTLMFVNEPNTSLVTSNGPFGGNIVVSDGYWTRVVSYDTQAKAYMTYIGAGGTYTGASANYNLFYVNTRGGKMYMSFDGNSERDMGNWNASNNTVHQLFAVPGNNYSFKGKYNELILWTGDKSANRSAISTNINTYYSIYNPMDSDAQAFITAAGITDSTQQSAVNTLVTSLKSAGLWTKMKAIYPFVGGTASSHKFNLKDPRDLDAAYRLVFNGGWTHSSTGALPNGTNGYADTKLAPSSALSLNSTSFGFYGYKSTPEKTYQIGTEGGFAVGGSSLAVTYFDNFNANPRFVSALNGGSAPNGVNTTISGMYMVSRASANSIVAVKNTTTLTTGTSAAVGLSNSPLFIGSYNAQGSPSGYSNTDFRMAYISDGLTTSEMSTLYTAVQAFQTTLGRQVA